MITYVHHPEICPEDGGWYMPVIVCDVCGSEVHTGDGGAWWTHAVNADQPDPRVWHTHKGDCAWAVDRRLARTGVLVLDTDLDEHLAHLGCNYRKVIR